MKASLKTKASTAVLWSFVDRAGQYGIQAVVSLVLTRLLLPTEIGLVGMVWVFIAVGQILIDSGFGQALLQKPDCTKVDECSVFYFNLLVAIVAAGIVWVFAPVIAAFYEIPELINLVRISTLSLPLGALGLIHGTLLSKQLDLKTQAKAGFIAVLLSGTVGLVMAYSGFGVWSLVAQTVMQNAARSAVLWAYSPWRPQLLFSWDSLREMFPIGARITASGVLNAIFRNLYPVAIGKLFSARDLGLYAIAGRIPSLITESLTTIVSRVTLPVLPTLVNEPERYKQTFRKAQSMMMIINTPLMAGIAVTADPLVRVLLTEKWIPAVPYMQLMCLIMIFSPSHYGYLEALLCLGKSEIYLRLEIIKKVFIVVNIAVAYRWGITGLLVGELIACVITFILQSYYVHVWVRYSFSEMVADLLPMSLVTLAMSGAIWLVQTVHIANALAGLTLQLLLGAGCFIALCWIFHLRAFADVLEFASNIRGRFGPGKAVPAKS